MGKGSKKDQRGWSGRGGGGGGGASPKPPVSRRKTWSNSLHRRPRLWDVLLYEASTMLEDRCRAARARVRSDVFSFRESELPAVGWMLGRGLGIVIEQRAGHALKAGAVNPLAALAAGPGELVDEIVADARIAFGGLIARYLEERRGQPVEASHADLQYLAGALADGLAAFFSEHCAPGAKVHRSLLEPLGDPGIMLPDNGRSLRPEHSSGDPSRDVYELGLVVHDDQGPTELKGLVVQLATHDPWLFAEFDAYARAEVARMIDRPLRAEDLGSREAIQVADRFLFRPTRLDGKSPVQILIDRQLWLGDVQRRRLQAWADRAYTSLFRIETISDPFLDLIDLRRDARLHVLATRSDVFQKLRPGQVLMTRVTPWDEHWVLSGAQSILNSFRQSELAQMFDDLAVREPDSLRGV